MKGYQRLVTAGVLAILGPSLLAAAESPFSLLGTHPSNQPPPVHLVVDVVGIVDSALRGDVPAGPGQVIAFDRGPSHGAARYALRAGTYTFTPTEKGWELYHSPPPAR